MQTIWWEEKKTFAVMAHIHTPCTQNSTWRPKTIFNRHRVKREKKLHAKLWIHSVCHIPIEKSYHTQKSSYRTRIRLFFSFFSVFDKFSCAQLNDWWWHCFKFFIKSENVKSHGIFCPFPFETIDIEHSHTNTHKYASTYL